jgi:hypothetical protein
LSLVTAATRERLAQTMSRDLSPLPLCAVMINGIHMGEHLVLVALGIDDARPRARAWDVRRGRPKLVAGPRAYDAQINPKSVDVSKRAA